MRFRIPALPALAAAVIGTWAVLAQYPRDPLEQGFQNPPESARPRVWWHWMNGFDAGTLFYESL